MPLFLFSFSEMTKLLQVAVPVVLALLCLIPTVDRSTRTGMYMQININTRKMFHHCERSWASTWVRIFQFCTVFSLEGFTACTLEYRCLTVITMVHEDQCCCSCGYLEQRCPKHCQPFIEPGSEPNWIFLYNANNSVLVSTYTNMLFYPIRARGHLSALFWSQECLNFIFIGIHEGIRLRECDSGTAWNRVETGDCPLTSPTQGIEVTWIFEQYHSHYSVHTMLIRNENITT